MRRFLPILLLLGCGPRDDFTFREPGDAPPLRGPGGPAVQFAEEELFQVCAFLDGGPEDWDHHNLVAGYRGHLVLPWAPEWGQGGLSFFEVDDPCDPVRVADSYDPHMRETHAIGFFRLEEGDHAGDYAVVNAQHGIQVWDVTDETAAFVTGVLEEDFLFWPDAYARVPLAVFVQYPWVYVAAADNGLLVVDIADPTAPVLVRQLPLDLRAGGVFAVGNLLLVTPAEQTHALLLDVSVPDDPQPVPGGWFAITDRSGDPKEAYHGNLVGNTALFARKEGAGGPILFDISDPSAPAFLGDHPTEGGNGGYAFMDEGIVFQGDSHWGKVLDARDPTAIVEIGTGYLEGDLDTNTPYGNVAVLSVDDDGVKGEASGVMPWATDPDATAPVVLRIDPEDGATGVPVTARIGVGFDDFIEPSTVFAGSIRLWDQDGGPVDGWGSGQETIATYAPKAPLLPGTTYTIEVMAGGVTDLNGNAVAQTVTASFTTAGTQ